jgi:hypothetical protein
VAPRATARLPGRCPLCDGGPIRPGQVITRIRVEGRYIWTHRGCAVAEARAAEPRRRPVVMVWLPGDAPGG